MDYLSPAFSKHGLFLAEPRTIWHGPNMLMDVLDRTKFQVPLAIDQSFHGFFGQDEHQRPFGMDQMSQRTKCSLIVSGKYQIYVRSLVYDQNK